MLANPHRARFYALAASAPDGESSPARLELVGEETAKPDGTKTSHEARLDFYELVASRVRSLWTTRADRRLVLVAAPTVLHPLRAALGRHLDPRDAVPTVTLSRDLTWLRQSSVHDALARAGLLPSPRG